MPARYNSTEAESFSKLLASQATSLASLSVSNRRSPAGFNFDLDALIDVPDTAVGEETATKVLQSTERYVVSMHMCTAYITNSRFVPFH